MVYFLIIRGGTLLSWNLPYTPVWQAEASALHQPEIPEETPPGQNPWMTALSTWAEKVLSSIKGASQKIQSEKPPYHIGPNLQVYTTGRHDRLPLTSVRERNSPEGKRPLGSHDNKETFIKEGQPPIPENVKDWGIEEEEKTVVEKEIQRISLQLDKVFDWKNQQATSRLELENLKLDSPAVTWYWSGYCS